MGYLHHILEDIVFLGAVSLLAAYQLARFARKVGNARRKFKVVPPETTGDPGFVRHFRAQQNTLEFFPVFLVCLWVSGLFFNQVVAALVGLFYIYAREEYFNGYAEATEKRLGAFKKSVLALQVFLVLSLAGIVNTLLASYAGIDIKANIAKKYLNF
ncbi:microsomal glutathione S-transferase 2-like [Liolophura sinensis]|uniref:microsomal glutathione S-transferase 2-like n=1 Tax=Liolophura sinensis TaxID=3198878 RepID=UPI003158A3B7